MKNNLMTVKNKATKECTNKKGLYLVESDKLLRVALRKKIFESSNFIPLGESSYSDDLSDKIIDIKPNILVLSSFRADTENIKHLQKIKFESPTTKTVVIVNESDESEFYKAARAGVKAYCLQDYTADKLLCVINKVIQGNCHYDESVSNLIYNLVLRLGTVDYFPIDKPVEEQLGITERECEVVLAAAKYDEYAIIAKHLCISPHTVKVHLTNAYRKLNVSGKLPAVLKVLEHFYGIKF